MEDTGNKTASLSSLLEQDREMVMAQLGAGRAQDQALQVLEKEADRLMYQTGACEEGQAAFAQGMLQVLKHALPLICAVTDAEVWEKDSPAASPGRRVSIPAVICGIAGAAFVIAGMTGSGLFAPLRVLWAAAGCALLLLGGYLAASGRGRGTGAKKRKDPSVRQTFLVDPDMVWHTLQGTLLGADHSLEEAAEQERAAGQEETGFAAASLQKADLQFYSDLLENAYALRRRNPSDAGHDEQVENIRFYLHAKGIETEDYSPQNARWFEILPSGGPAVTIRPALIQNDAVIRKGVATGH